MKSVLNLISGITAAVMTICAIPAQQIAAAGDPAQEITKIELFGINDALFAGYTPAYTAHLSEECAAQMTLANEAWVNIETDESCLRSTGNAIPVPEDGEVPYYAYYIQLVPKDGYAFPEYFTLYYDGWEISMMDYDVTVQPDYIAIRCDFLGTVTPASEPAALDTVEITGAQLSFSDGDAPVFSGMPAAGSHFSILTEGWEGGGERVMSRTELNEEAFPDGNRLLTAFSGGTEYTYFLWIVPDDGYVFGGSPTLIINGKACGGQYHIMQNHIEIRTDHRLTVPAAATTPPVTVTTEKPAATTGTAATTAAPVTTTEKPRTTTLLTTTAPATTAAFDPDLLYGDVDQNGSCSVADAVLLLRWLAEDGIFAVSPNGLRAADINRDGILTMTDAVLLIQLIGQQPKQTAAPVRPAEPDSDMPELPDTAAAAEWILKPDGSSKAFTEKVLGRLTVSAEENALSRDGQLQFRELTDAEGLALNERFSGDGITVLDGWEADAGLGIEEHLPGSYTAEYDLSTLNLPEELYGELHLLRIDQTGTVSEYAFDVNGNTACWESDQNSAWLWVLVPALIGTMIYYYYEKIAPEAKERDSIWNADEKDRLARYTADHCIILYADTETNDEKKAREARVKAIVEETEKRARKMAIEEAENAWIPWGMLSWGYEREVNRITARILADLLKQDAVYQKELAEIEYIPADVRLLAYDFDKALDYLRGQEGCPKLGAKPVIYFTTALQSGTGNAETPQWYAAYLQMGRTGFADVPRVSKKTKYYDIYGETVSETTGDNMLVTLTHEVYHLMQNKKLSAHVRSNLKFSEMSAMIVEHRCGKYYEEHEMINAYSEEISKSYELYAIAIDDNEPDEELLRAEGYALSQFWDYMSGKLNIELTGWELITAFKRTSSITALFRETFHNDSSNQLLDIYWKAFQKSISREANSLAHDLMGKTKNGDGYFPSVVRKLSLSDSHSSAPVRVNAAPFSCAMTGITGAETGGWTALIVRDPDFGELLPGHTFLLPAGADGQPIGQESKRGLVLNTKAKTLCYRELQDKDALGGSGYTVRYIPAPQTPAVELDEENEILTVTLRSGQSKEGANGLTDRFLLIASVNGKETYTQKIDFADWSKEIRLPFGTLHVIPNQTSRLEITVCELIDAGTDSTGTQHPDVRTAAAVPFEASFETEYPELRLRTVSAGGFYGDLSVSSTEEETTFRLDKDGFFSFTFPAEYKSWDTFPDDYDPDGMYSPFEELSRGHSSHTGFTVTGKVQNTEDVNNWTADLSTCAGSFETSYYEYYRGVFIGGETGDPHIVQEGSWKGSGMDTGTLELTTDETGTVRKVAVIIHTGDDLVRINATFKE
ncbi:MAG: dockerin type I repeat-containing protein [Oscillospiraceae bacterium]|nr:dockerin type I repeat-containing protein [Oscillospiraceae bacterium]